MPKSRSKIGSAAVLLPLCLALASCASAPSPPNSAPKPRHKPIAPPLRSAGALPVPRIAPMAGLENVLGATAESLVKQFGPPRLDVHEGDSRKLQFNGTACILDIFLYPPNAGKPPLASYISARRSDGRDVDKVACVMALRKK